MSVSSRNGRTQRARLRLHRPPTLLPSQTTHRFNIPVTKPARTLADLRRTSPNAEHRKALRQAEFLRLDTGDVLGDGTRSGLESAFLACCRRHQVPIPEVNVKLGPYTVDFLWRAERLVVETDSFHTHGGAVAFEEDRQRDLWLKARGYEVVRVTDRRLKTDPRGLAAALRMILGKAATAG